MYDTITIDRSLFSINQSFVENFKSIAFALEPYYTLNMNGAITNDDVWTTAFNIWLLAHPDEMLVLESVEKTFYYSSNFIIYEHLKNDYYFNYIRNHEQWSTELIFLFSIHLTNNLNAYWHDLLINNDLQDIIEKNKKRHYFEGHNESSAYIDSFINDQARFVKVLMSDIKSNNTFSRKIKESSASALIEYHKYLNKNEITA